MLSHWFCLGRLANRSARRLATARLRLKLRRATFARCASEGWRPRPELNRGTRFCRPLRNHSATWPLTGAGVVATGRRNNAPLYRGMPLWRQRYRRKSRLSLNAAAPQLSHRKLAFCRSLRFAGPLPHNARGGSRERKIMFDTATARRMMVDGQVRTADVTNLDLIAAMLAVPRERFVPPALAEQAYRRRRYCDRRRPRAAQADGAGQAHSGGAGARRRSCARCRLRHRLFVGGAGAARRLGGGAGKDEALGAAGESRRSLRPMVVSVTVVSGAVDRRLAGSRALRCHLHQWRDRDRA